MTETETRTCSFRGRAARKAAISKEVSRATIYLILIIGAVVMLFPLIWMISTSLKPIEQTMVMPPQWIPKPLQFKNYLDAVQYIPFFTYAANTLIICLLGTLGMVVSSSLVAYGFSRIEWRWPCRGSSLFVSGGWC